MQLRCCSLVLSCQYQGLTLNVRGTRYLGLTRSISWLLMSWRRNKGHIWLLHSHCLCNTSMARHWRHLPILHDGQATWPVIAIWTTNHGVEWLRPACSGEGFTHSSLSCNICDLGQPQLVQGKLKSLYFISFSALHSAINITV